MDYSKTFELLCSLRKNDIKKALLSTMELFRLEAVEVAGKLNYKYPTKADEYSTEWVIKSL